MSEPEHKTVVLHHEDIDGVPFSVVLVYGADEKLERKVMTRSDLVSIDPEKQADLLSDWMTKEANEVW